jgi:hypothetical protein
MQPGSLIQVRTQLKSIVNYATADLVKSGDMVSRVVARMDIFKQCETVKVLI